MCCGASRKVGMLPQLAYLIGEDDGSQPVYVVVLDVNLLPNVRAGTYRYVKGSGVAQAFTDGKIQTVEEYRATPQTTTRYIVTLSDGRSYKFTVKSTAEQYAAQSGGTLSEVTT